MPPGFEGRSRWSMGQNSAQPIWSSRPSSPNPTPWSRILQGTGLPGRAGEAMVLLVALLASPLLVAGLSLPLGAGGGL